VFLETEKYPEIHAIVSGTAQAAVERLLVLFKTVACAIPLTKRVVQ